MRIRLQLRRRPLDFAREHEASQAYRGFDTFPRRSSWGFTRRKDFLHHVDDRRHRGKVKYRDIRR